MKDDVSVMESDEGLAEKLSDGPKLRWVTICPPLSNSSHLTSTRLTSITEGASSLWADQYHQLYDLGYL